MARRIENFIDFIDYTREKDYMMNLITYAISPTIAGYKPSSIITISNQNKGMYDLWYKYGDEYIDNINLKVFEIMRKENLIILLFYNEKLLSQILFHENNMNFLLKFGYSNLMSLDMCLQLLKYRYQYMACPHEVGIFLGIPVKDVEAFIDCNGKQCILCGYWKVYHDREKALKVFESYDKTRENVVRLLKQKVEPIEMINMLNSEVSTV
ncbi:hypothetical protein CPAST_c13850 [Clostridium pasteurianum DSM 525 = ATCC 6013]|uniref:DUF3793 family protein n=1 Tax=Clostridium pasteurianum DSM 525 = ATCC 6013 TaxID=1262449 RepID=A0A0H3J213_CLOPA|nr:DUF3793 family protein [Clostridium pasteurianum]AJA47464.1 hypothetical protein CPAST_c13850 [Clostridium pasteurianum DSM 525 = ATCC 6013]AJA51452.1 hypothetical protein CLPA_c13850 [Clostridium pasteurianum DSM 525 = ATCC 6013]AOZ74788.1 hypothetical protein AQ983_06690 [Clostridium pasteurianum DSM 525 = ATCC 6013]AOZ78584.1 hypothetical protein AQ984_06680 [Clostridium pasteurianum]ELP58799.1 hypothetical protein F502_13498 [Clostridium pasteurianum DSM 525 = ATCC 6013]